MNQRRLAVVLGLVLLAATLRVATLAAAGPVTLLGDENYYVEVADNLARGQGHRYDGALEGEALAWRPPGHAWLLAQLVNPKVATEVAATEDPALVRRMQWSQVACGVLVVLLTTLLGASLFDPRTGAVAGLLAAIDPALVTHSHYLWSETSFSVLLLLALIALVRAREDDHWPSYLLAGLLFGLAALIRELALLAAGAAGLWCVWPTIDRGRVLRVGAMLLVAVTLTLPWIARNHQQLGRVIGLSTVGWFATAEGNTLEDPEWWTRRGPEQARFHARYFSTRDELARLDLARSHALTRIAAEQPGWLPRKLVRNLALLTNPDAVVRTKVRNGAYGDRPARVVGVWLAASGPAWILLASVAALGVAASRHGRRRSLAVLLFGAALALHVFANATPRFRVPWVPLLCIYAAHALVLGGGLRGAIDRRGAIGAAVALCFLVGVALPYYLVLGGRP